LLDCFKSTQLAKSEIRHVVDDVGREYLAETMKLAMVNQMTMKIHQLVYRKTIFD
jgi:hypothetical protein